mgnify:CR=1 FL=1
MTEAEKLMHARKLNLARRHLNSEQKRTLIRDQLKATPEKSDRQIAQALGVSQPTVSAHRKELETDGELIKFINATCSDGRSYPRTRKPVSVFNPTKREEKAMQKPEVIARMQEDGISPFLPCSF